jgi:hypothetical protein
MRNLSSTKCRKLSFGFLHMANVLTVAMTLFCSGTGWAQSAAPEKDTPSCFCTTKEGEPPKRPVPDYDGRGPDPTTLGDVLIWVPRTLLLPPYLVTEYAIRQPIGSADTYAEQNHWPTALYDFFAFGPDHQFGIFPTFFIDFNLRPSFGLHFFWNKAFAPGNQLTTDLAYGGTNWIKIAVGDRYSFSSSESISVQAKWQRRPDTLYYGVGSDVTNALVSRVGSDVITGTVIYDKVVDKFIDLETTAQIKRLVFRNYSCCGDPSLQQRVEAGQLPPPPGYQQNYTAVELGFKAVVDTRLAHPDSHSGIRAAFGLGLAGDVVPGFDTSWARYGASLEENFDITGRSRVLSIGVTALFVDPLGSQPVTFTELVSLGGNEPFAGFYPNTLRDRSALAAQVGWHWPVFAFLDGVAEVSFGNVFDAHLSNFRFDLLRMSADLGIRTSGILPGSFEILFGIGTNTIRDGFGVDTVRLAFGVVYGL